MKRGDKIRAVATVGPLVAGQLYTVLEYSRDGERLCGGDNIVENRPGVRIQEEPGACFFASRFEEEVTDDAL